MSKELTVVPLRDNRYSLFNGLCFDRCDYNKYDELVEQATHLLEEGIHWQDSLYEPDYQDYVTTDPYGDKIRVIDNQTFILIYEVDNLTIWDKAIMAFLKQLPKDHKLVLYFH